MAKPLTFDNDIVKRPNIGPVDMTEQQLLEIMDCFDDPLYFMSTFMKVQHPIRGAISFEPYEFQVRLINAFHKNRFSIALTGRQLGKSNTFNTIISKDKSQIKIGRVLRYSIREKIINVLENALFFLAK